MTTAALRTEGRTKRHGGFYAPSHLDLEVPTGVLGYLEPNGAGKSTNIRAGA